MTQARLTEQLAQVESALTARAKPLAYTEGSRAAPAKLAHSDYQPPPAATSNRSATRVHPIETMEEEVLAEVAGIVLGDAGSNILVRLENENLTVHFPADLFPEDLIANGTGVTYQVVRRPNGMRYQRFVGRAVKVDRARVQEVLDALDQIRFRTK